MTYVNAGIFRNLTLQKSVKEQKRAKKEKKLPYTGINCSWLSLLQ